MNYDYMNDPRLSDKEQFEKALGEVKDQLFASFIAIKKDIEEQGGEGDANSDSSSPVRVIEGPSMSREELEQPLDQGNDRNNQSNPNKPSRKSLSPKEKKAMLIKSFEDQFRRTMMRPFRQGQARPPKIQKLAINEAELPPFGYIESSRSPEKQESRSPPSKTRSSRAEFPNHSLRESRRSPSRRPPIHEQQAQNRNRRRPRKTRGRKRAQQRTLRPMFMTPETLKDAFATRPVIQFKPVEELLWSAGGKNPLENSMRMNGITQVLMPYQIMKYEGVPRESQEFKAVADLAQQIKDDEAQSKKEEAKKAAHENLMNKVTEFEEKIRTDLIICHKVEQAKKRLTKQVYKDEVKKRKYKDLDLRKSTCRACYKGADALIQSGAIDVLKPLWERQLQESDDYPDKHLDVYDLNHSHRSLVARKRHVLHKEENQKLKKQIDASVKTMVENMAREEERLIRKEAFMKLYLERLKRKRSTSTRSQSREGSRSGSADHPSKDIVSKKEKTSTSKGGSSGLAGKPERSVSPQQASQNQEDAAQTQEADSWFPNNPLHQQLNIEGGDSDSETVKSFPTHSQKTANAAWTSRTVSPSCSPYKSPNLSPLRSPRKQPLKGAATATVKKGTRPDGADKQPPKKKQPPKPTARSAVNGKIKGNLTSFNVFQSKELELRKRFGVPFKHTEENQKISRAWQSFSLPGKERYKKIANEINNGDYTLEEYIQREIAKAGTGPDALKKLKRMKESGSTISDHSLQG